MRYKILSESVTSHCCFEFSVMDTEQGNIVICECFEREDAEKICKALNGGEMEYIDVKE